MTDLDRAEQLAGLLDGELVGLALGHTVFDAMDTGERVEDHRVALHQGVEEMPLRGERLVPGRRGAWEPAEVFAGQTRCDLA